MENPATLQPGPTSLPLGSRVGAWRVVGAGARGAWGTVYRVERQGFPEAGPFALKLATWPKDARFEREVELLWRIRHPHVPRLQDRGWWTHSSGVLFPFVVMDWVEGVPLYEWSARHRPTQRQVMQVLAQVASALAAVHAVEGLHRDVKGHNILVRPEEPAAVLMDLGAGTFRGASALTWEALPPGTPAYRGPEALRHELRWKVRSEAVAYEATPADDVYALGVTAFRLVTGSYPPPVEVVGEVEEVGVGDAEQAPPLELRAAPLPPEALAGVCPALAALIRQMLVEEPSERGSARALAQALEHAARTSGASAERPVPACAGEGASVLGGPWGRLRRALGGRAWSMAAAAAGVLLAVAAGWAVHSLAEGRLWSGEASGQSESGGRTGGLVDSAAGGSSEAAEPTPPRKIISREMPKEPLPGQRRAPCKGKSQVALHGGCWFLIRNEPPCDEDSYEWKGKCYVPIYPAGRPPSSVK
jgi:eukaryotic-like serine/threonine-protein kinase